MRAQSAKVKEGVQKKVAELKSAYADPLFIEYLCQDLEKSKNPIMEGSKIVKELNSDLEKKWQVKQKQKIEELLQKNYPAYNKTPHFREYLYESITASETPLARFKRIEEELEKASQQPPIEWQNCLTQNMNRDILARLENIRNDRLFRAYVKTKIQWYENVKDKKLNGTPQQMEELEHQKAYVLTLRKAEEWIGNQLYFNFLSEREANYVKFLEKDFNDLKARYRNQEQQRQVQAQAQIQANLAQSTAPSTPQYSQQNAQLNTQQNQHQMAHQQQKQQQQQHIYAQPQDQNQELKHYNSYHQYQHNQEPVDPPNISSQIGNNYQNQHQPSSYRTSHNNAMSHNPTKTMNGQMGSQYVDYNHTDNSDQQTFSSPAQNYPITSQGSHNSYTGQSQRSQQFSYSQQQSGYNQFTGHNQDSINMTRQSSIPSNTQNQANYQAQSHFSASTDFYSSSAYPQAQNQSQFPQQSHSQVHKAQPYAQSQSVSHNAQSNQHLQFPQQTQVTNAHPNQFDFQTMHNSQQQSGHLQQQTNVVSPYQDFSDFIPSSQNYSETYVADGKRHREDMGDFFNTNNQNPQGEFWGADDKNRHLEEYMHGSKKVKINPLSQPDLHITKSKSNTISSTLTPSTMEGESPQAKQNGIDLSQIRKDPRFVILDEQVYPGFVDLVINRNDNGTLSDYEKITLRIFQDVSKRIEIYGMANIGEFYQTYGDNLNTAMQTGQLETLLEYWLEFLGTCAAKAANKLQELDDIF